MEVQILTMQASAIDANVASNTSAKATLSFCHPARIVAAGVLVRTEVDATFTVKMLKETVAGTASNVAAGSPFATLVVPANSQNEIIYDELTDDGIEVAAGDEVTIYVTVDPAATLSCVPFVNYVRIDESLVNIAKASVTA